MVKMALNATPTINTNRNTRCNLICLFVSNTLSKMIPAPPSTDDAIASELITFSLLLIFGSNLPRCLNHLSIDKLVTKQTDVIDPPTIKSGFKMSAPTSEMYAIDPS
jgi:hypothetical protein